MRQCTFEKKISKNFIPETIWLGVFVNELKLSQGFI